MKGGEDEFREKAGAICTGWDGECSNLGEPLETDDRSEDALWMETSCDKRKAQTVSPAVRECIHIITAGSRCCHSHPLLVRLGRDEAGRK